MPILLLLGGARAGKSALAVSIAVRSRAPVTFIATAEANDQEMRNRIVRHRAERPREWTTVEEPIRLAEAVRAVHNGQFLIVDCLTLWASNLMARGEDHESILRDAQEVAALLAGRLEPVVVVSNEVGLGIVPEHAVARRFRDTLGAVNTVFAAAAERAVLVAAGRTLELGSAAKLMDEVGWDRPAETRSHV